MSGLEAAARLEHLGGLAVEQQVLVDQLHHDQPHQLAHVLAADQLLKAAREHGPKKTPRPKKSVGLETDTSKHKTLKNGRVTLASAAVRHQR